MDFDLHFGRFFGPKIDVFEKFLLPDFEPQGCFRNTVSLDMSYYVCMLKFKVYVLHLITQTIFKHLFRDAMEISRTSSEINGQHSLQSVKMAMHMIRSSPLICPLSP